MTLGEAHGKLTEMFVAHVCDEYANQAAARIVGENTN